MQLATLVDAPPEGDKWLHEIKFDGYRLLGFLSGGEVGLRTRNGLDWTSKFPSVATAIAGLKAKDAVLDMEAVVLDENGKSGFQALQAALGEGGRRDRIVAYAFDLLHLDGEDLTRLKLTERKDKLAKLLKKSKPGSSLRFSDHVSDNGAEMLAKACELGTGGHRLQTRRCALHGGTRQELAESEVPAAAGIHHHRLQQCEERRPRAWRALSRLSTATAPSPMPARSAPASR